MFIILFMKVVQVNNLKKHFIEKKWWKPREKAKITKAVDNISFEINEAEIVGLLGPNGAGKTTTSQMLLGSLTPTSGEICYFGKKFTEKKKELLNQVNFSSAYISLPHKMTVAENLDVYARLYQVKNRKQRIKKLLTEFEIEQAYQKNMHQLSAGQNTRVLLAKAFINYPRLLILDEPTASLDPDIAVKVRQFLLKQQKEYNVAMLFTSHNMHEVQEICDRIIFLNHGKIIAHDTPLGLIKKLKKTRIKMRVVKKKRVLEEYLKKSKMKFYSKKEKAVFEIDEALIPKTLYQLSDKGVRYIELEILKPTLEDFFLEIVKKGKI